MLVWQPIPGYLSDKIEPIQKKGLPPGFEVESNEDKTSTYVGPKFCQVLYCLEDNPTAAAVTDPDPGPARELFEVQQKILRCASKLMFINF